MDIENRAGEIVQAYEKHFNIEFGEMPAVKAGELSDFMSFILREAADQRKESRFTELFRLAMQVYYDYGAVYFPRTHRLAVSKIIWDLDEKKRDLPLAHELAHAYQRNLGYDSIKFHERLLNGMKFPPMLCLFIESAVADGHATFMSSRLFIDGSFGSALISDMVQDNDKKISLYWENKGIEHLVSYLERINPRNEKKVRSVLEAMGLSMGYYIIKEKEIPVDDINFFLNPQPILEVLLESGSIEY